MKMRPPRPVLRADDRGEITDAALEAAPPQQPEIGARKEAGADAGQAEVHRGGNRAVGFRMTISPIADLFTDPRSTPGVGTFGDAAKVSALVGVS